jgi:Ca2+-binding EF-hand superfamily protein
MTKIVQYFTSQQIDANVSEVRQMLTEEELVSDFIANMFGTERNGVIEWYEFLDFLTVLKNMKRPLSRKHVQEKMRIARKEGIERPWAFDANGVSSMPGALKAAKTAFDGLDTNDDGVLDSSELYKFVRVPDDLSYQRSDWCLYPKNECRI